MNWVFPTDQEVEDRKILPLSYDFYMEDSDKYNSVITDFVGVLIKSLEEDKKTELSLKELHDMRDRFQP